MASVTLDPGTPGCWRVTYVLFADDPAWRRVVVEEFDDPAETLAYLRQLRPNRRMSGWRLEHAATHQGDTRWRRVRMPPR